MQNITREAVEALLATGSPKPAVTIYAPMHTTASSPHISENQIRLKNLVAKACDDIRVYDEGSRLARELEDMLSQQSDDMSFWESQASGLLICARPGMIGLFRLPVDTDEYVAVDDNFHLAPVLAILNEDQPFYVLMVEQHNPKLFEGDMYGLRFAGVELPDTLQAALNIDEANQKSENQGSASGSSLNTGGFNGRGGARNPQEEDRMKFFRIIDHIISQTDTRSLPLILAGVDSEIAEYRAISKYPKLMEGAISRGRADSNMDDMFRDARAIIEDEMVMPVREAAIEEYQRLEGANPDRTAHDLKSILAATEQGRVDKLLATMGRRTTDTIRDSVDAVTKISFPERESSRTLNQLALKVWQMSGTIINLTPHEMPHGAPMVARLRY